MKLHVLIVGLLALLAPVTTRASVATGGSYVLERAAIAGGGGRAVGGSYVLQATAGHRAAGRTTGGTYVLIAGFHHRSEAGSVPDGCGDGNIDAPEQCDLGARNGAADVCCSTTCELELQDKVCRAAAGPCDVADRCTGSSPLCSPLDAKSNLPCNIATYVCLRDATCDGITDACPANPFNNGAICSDDDECTLTDQCDAGACRAGTRVCDVSVPSGEFTVRLAGRKKTRTLLVTCTSQTAGTCDAVVTIPTAAAVGAVRADVDRGADDGQTITRPLRKPKKVKARRTVKLKLRLTPAGIALLKKLSVGTTIDATVRARVQNDRGLLGVRRVVALRRRK